MRRACVSSVLLFQGISNQIVVPTPPSAFRSFAMAHRTGRAPRNSGAHRAARHSVIRNLMFIHNLHFAENRRKHGVDFSRLNRQSITISERVRTSSVSR